MKRMFTAALTVAVLAVGPGAQADMTPKKVARIAKQVFHAQIKTLEPAPPPVGDNSPDHAITADHAEFADDAEHARRADNATTADRATTAGHATTATTAGHATTADRAANVEHATTAGSAATAETAEVADLAVAANPMAYGLVLVDGRVDPARSYGITTANVALMAYTSGNYCFSGIRPKGIQLTVEMNGTTDYRGIPALQHPIVVAALGRGDCPAGTEFYVRAFDSTDGDIGFASFFVSLVL